MRGRVAAMVDRVMHRYSREIVAVDDLRTVNEALRRTLSLRDRVLEDDHDIDLLHPARTLLILLDDVAISDPLLLAAAALIESERADLRTQPDSPCTLEPNDLAAAYEIARTVPTPLHTADPLELIEGLVVLPPERVALAIAERLDHARHLHLRPRSVWEERRRLEELVYLPLAGRIGGLLGARYQRWYASFVDPRRKL